MADENDGDGEPQIIAVINTLLADDQADSIRKIKDVYWEIGRRLQTAIDRKYTKKLGTKGWIGVKLKCSHTHGYNCLRAWKLHPSFDQELEWYLSGNADWQPGKATGPLFQIELNKAYKDRGKSDAEKLAKATREKGGTAKTLLKKVGDWKHRYERLRDEHRKFARDANREPTVLNAIELEIATEEIVTPVAPDAPAVNPGLPSDPATVVVPFPIRPPSPAPADAHVPPDPPPDSVVTEDDPPSAEPPLVDDPPTDPAPPRYPLTNRRRELESLRVIEKTAGRTAQRGERATSPGRQIRADFFARALELGHLITNAIKEIDNRLWEQYEGRDYEDIRSRYPDDPEDDPADPNPTPNPDPTPDAPSPPAPPPSPDHTPDLPPPDDTAASNPEPDPVREALRAIVASTKPDEIVTCELLAAVLRQFPMQDWDPDDRAHLADQIASMADWECHPAVNALVMHETSSLKLFATTENVLTYDNEHGVRVRRWSDIEIELAPLIAEDQRRYELRRRQEEAQIIYQSRLPKVRKLKAMKDRIKRFIEIQNVTDKGQRLLNHIQAMTVDDPAFSDCTTFTDYLEAVAKKESEDATSTTHD